MAEIGLLFLDQIRLVRGGKEVADGSLPRKLIALLGILSTEATRTGSVDRICHLLWPDVEELYGRKSLNQLLVRGRRILPGALDRPAEHLVGLSTAVACDVHDLLFREPFKSQVGDPPQADYEFLPGYSIRGCPELNDWLDSTRSTVRARAARAALERIEGLAPADASAWAALAYRLDRGDERAAAAYIRSLSAVKGPAAAWAAFTEHRHWLADALDITPSARLTASVAEACREQARVRPPAVISIDAPVPAEVRPTAASRPARRFEVLAGLGAIGTLSLVAWLNLGTPAIEAGVGRVELVVSPPVAGSAIGDSAIRLASTHLALHGVATEVVENEATATALRVVVPGWRGRGVEDLSVAPLTHLTADRLAAAVTDSVLVLRQRGARPEAPVAYGSSGASRKLLREAADALTTARALVATGGASAALVMLERADSLASRAGRVRGSDWQAHALRAEIANQTFWHRLAAGVVDPGVLHRGIIVADTAVERGGATEALKARAALSFSLWVFGSSDAEAAGKAAQLDYAAIAASSPGNGEAWTRLAQLYHADGRLSDAYAAAFQSLPAVTGQERQDSFMELFLAALDRRDNVNARRWCAEIRFHYGDSWLSATCSAMYAWADPASTDRVLQSGLFEEATTLRPSFEGQLALLNAGADLVRGNDSAAFRRIRLARPPIDHDPELANIWAGILVALGRPDSALSTLRSYVQNAPSRRAVIGRPWLRPLYRANESWQEFLARLTGVPASPSTASTSFTPQPPPTPTVREVTPN